MKQQQGFTLIEMVLALAIFALLSVTAYQLLQGTLRQEEISQEKSARFAEIQRAFNTMERDFSAMLPRGVRRDGQGIGQAVIGVNGRDAHSGDSIEFTQANWFNPADRLARSTLQRVRYDLYQNQLRRRFSPYLDVPSGSITHQQTLLTQVSGLELRYHQQGRWQDAFSASEQLPTAVEVTVVLTDYGKLTRRFPIASLPGNKP